MPFPFKYDGYFLGTEPSNSPSPHPLPPPNPPPPPPPPLHPVLVWPTLVELGREVFVQDANNLVITIFCLFDHNWRSCGQRNNLRSQVQFSSVASHFKLFCCAVILQLYDFLLVESEGGEPIWWGSFMIAQIEVVLRGRLVFQFKKCQASSRESASILMVSGLLCLCFCLLVVGWSLAVHQVSSRGRSPDGLSTMHAVPILLPPFPRTE